MPAAIRTLKITSLILALTVVTGCKDPAAEMAVARDAELAVLDESREALSALRGELAGLKDQLMAASANEDGEDGEDGEGGEGEGGEVAVDTEALTGQIAAKESEVLGAADTFTTEVIGFLNKYPMIEGEPPTEWQVRAIRMKSGEDMALAREYIDKGGDYKRAMTIYEEALKLDPENAELEAALASADELRYLSEERFAVAENGMSEAEVRAALGPVNLRNIRPYEDRKVTAWFYPTGEGGVAAAVWFRENKKGEVVVYKTDFQAVKGNEAGDG